MLPLGRDARGRPNKRSFGPWMQRVFRQLARLRGLRGGALDPFARHADRKLERDLIKWYQSILDTVTKRSPTLGDDTVEKILGAPMDIRGYGPVKEVAAHRVRHEVEAML
jgi:indolepyruvate ferredoxin oxidoreductase